jgi:quinohemoprotein amine dehydrogenase
MLRSVEARDAPSIRRGFSREKGRVHQCCRPIDMRMLTVAVMMLLAVTTPAFAQNQADAGIPVTDALVRAKCGSCHAADERGNMQRLSWSRATPEGWQASIKRMVTENGVAMTPTEGRAIVKYLSARHGLAPDEARPVMYAVERRTRDEAGTVNEALIDACTKCHQAARALSWRRTPEEWKQFVERHAARYQVASSAAAIAALAEAAPLHTPAWAAWTARAQAPALAGRWLVTAHLPGHGNFRGEMEVAAIGPDEFTTRTQLRAVDGPTVLTRTGRGLAFAGTAWRGRSSGSTPAGGAPDDPSNDAQEAMLIAADGNSAAGRWFWGQYQELGFDVTLRRPATEATLLLVEPPSLKIGSRGNRIRLIGEAFPTQVTAADLSAGPGATVRRIVSSTPGEIVAEVDIAGDAAPGRRTVSFRSSTLEGALAIYDRVDYLKVVPDSSLAAFGNQTYPRGFQQFEAIAYHRGADGKRRTADDVALGPVPAVWSMKTFYEIDQNKQDHVGTLTQGGFFTPAATNPGANYDVWIIATAADAGADATPLVGKSYLVVTVPTYSFDGRTYIRDLDRWVEDGSNP